MERRFFVLVVMITMLAAPVMAQPSATTGQWSGSIQCQLDIQLQGYTRHEIQTWTLTGEPPRTVGTGGVAIYPATWTYTGQGGLQRLEGSQMKMFQWAINVIPGEAPVSFVVRDGVLTIKRASSQQSRANGITGTRQVAVNGMAQQPTPITSFTLWEWALPWIEAVPGTSANGTVMATTENFAGGEMSSPVSGPRPPATCKYQFTKGGASGLTPVAQTCAVAQKFEEMKAYLTQQYDALIQQDPSKRIALTTQKQRLLHELDTQEQQNVGQACRGGVGSTTSAGGPTANGGSDTSTATNSPGGAATQNGATSNGTNSSGASSANGAAGTGNLPASAATGGKTGAPADNSQVAGGTTAGGATAQNSGVPRLIKVDPASAEQNTANLQVSIKGDSTHWLMGTSKLDFGPGITTIAGPFFISATDAYVVISVAPDAALGPRKVSVTSPYPGKTEGVSLPSGFNVTAPPITMTAVPLNNLPVTTLNSSTPPAATPAIDPAALKNRPTKQPKSISTSTAPPASGNYLVTVTGLRCAMSILDDPFDHDGKGDEVYAAVWIRQFDRNSGQALMETNVRTLTYGDIRNFPDRIQAGTLSPTGGIRGSDSIPPNFSADRCCAASNSRFPLKLFEGTLTDGMDALVFSPSVWEASGDESWLRTWGTAQNQLTASIFNRQEIKDQMDRKIFGPITLGATPSNSGNNLTGAAASVIVGSLGIPVLGLPVNAITGGWRDRPIGLVPVGVDATALPNTTIVLTREIIEAALNGSHQAVVNAAPGVMITTPKPGIMVFNFVDTFKPNDWQTLGLGLGLHISPGIFTMVLQVERR